MKPDFPSLAAEIAEPHPDMNIKVAAFTESKKSSNTFSIHYLGYSIKLAARTTSVFYLVSVAQHACLCLARWDCIFIMFCIIYILVHVITHSEFSQDDVSDTRMSAPPVSV